MKRLIVLFAAMAFVSVSVMADVIMLKDEQYFEADITSFDTYYLNVKLKNNKEAAIPWQEVRYIKHTTTPSSWLEQEYMTPEEVEVKTLVAPLSPQIAFEKSLFPGIILHGAGHFYGKDSNMGMSLMSAEIVSVIVMGMSLQQFLVPKEEANDYRVATIVFYSGATAFVLSWLYDIIFAGDAVKKFNSENQFISAEAADENSTGK